MRTSKVKKARSRKTSGPGPRAPAGGDSAGTPKQLSKREFYRTFFKIEVLSEEPLSEVELSDVAYNIKEGDWSGRFEQGLSESKNGKQIARLLRKQASSPEFFQLNDKGEDLEDGQ